jgi:hypothetical protein
MITAICLVASISINAVLIWYIRESIKRVNNLWQTLDIFRHTLVDYHKTLEKVYNMEIYYGEPVIESMIKETSDLLGLYNDLKDLTDEIISGDDSEKE